MILNSISTTQNEEDQIRLLRARRQMFAQGKLVLSLQLFLTVAIPVIGSLSTLKWPDLRGLVAFLSLTIAILDVTVLDRIQKDIRTLAAKAQEQFDCAVLTLPWDQFTVGPRLAPETLHEASSKYRKGQEDPTLRDWYPPVVAEAPLHLARIICQRTNLWYDAKLRRQYGRWVIGIAAALGLLLIGISVAKAITVESLVLSVLAPAAPIIIWSVREYYRQRHAADALERLRSEAEGFWNRAKNGACSELECATESRQFQNAIYDRRSSGPLIFDWIYWWQRPALEEQMNQGAKDFVREVVTQRNPSSVEG